MKKPTYSNLRVIVICMIVILISAIIIGPLFRRMESERQQQCLSNLRQLWLASMAYAKDNDGWMPIYINENPGHSIGSSLYRGIESPEELRTSLAGYMKNESAWFCPSDRYAGERTDIGGTWHVTSSYTFAFCKPGVLRSSGLVKGHQSTIKDIGRPSKYGLISDYVISEGSEFSGPHRGRMSLIYLDGHTQF